MVEPPPAADPLAPEAPAARLLGVASGRWVVFEEGDGIAIVDGRVPLAEALKARLLAGEGRSVRLLAPRLFEIHHAHAEALERAQDALAALGVDIAASAPARSSCASSRRRCARRTGGSGGRARRRWGGP